MRIAEFCVGRPRTDSSNGVELTVFRLSEAMASDNDVLTIGLSGKPMIPIPGVEVVNHAPANRLLPIPHDLMETLTNWRPDVVHIHSVYTPANSHLAWILRRRQIPYIVTPHGGYGSANEQHRRLLKRAYRAVFELAMLNGAEFIHSVGDTRDIMRLGSSSKIVETTKGLDTPASIGKRDRSMTDIPIPASGFKYGFVGRLDPLHKGLDVLVEAFATPALGDSFLVLVGPSHGSGRSDLEKLAQSKNVADRVIFTGPRIGVEKEQAISMFDVFVHTSRWEGGIPYAVLEAASLGTPLLLSPHADPLGVLSRAGASVDVDPSVEAVRAAMVEFRNSTSGRLEEMGKKARMYVTSNFSWQRMSDGLVAALLARGLGSS